MDPYVAGFLLIMALMVGAYLIRWKRGREQFTTLDFGLVVALCGLIALVLLYLTGQLHLESRDLSSITLAILSTVVSFAAGFAASEARHAWQTVRRTSGGTGVDSVAPPKA